MSGLKFFQSDLAIEYSAILSELKKTIERIKELNIDVSKEEKEIEGVEETCNDQLDRIIKTDDEYTITASLEVVYNSAIKSLKDIKSRLEKHEAYCTSFNKAEELNRMLSEGSLDTLSNYQELTIELLKLINTTDTRPFEEKKGLVEKIYNLAFEIIQFELIADGKSRVLDWVKTQPVIKSLMNSIVERRLSALSEKTLARSVIKNTINSVKSQSFNASFLNEEIILYLAFRNRKNREQVKRCLYDLLNEIDLKAHEIHTQTVARIEVNRRISSLKIDIKEAHIYKQVGILVGLIAALVCSEIVVNHEAAKIGHDEYRTDVEIITTSEKFTPKFPQYMPKIGDYYYKELTIYGLWNQKNGFYGDYVRNVESYNITDKNINTPEDFKNLNWFRKLFIEKEDKKETKPSIDTDELYDQAYVEIITYSQNPNDHRFVPDEEKSVAFLVILSIIICGFISTGIVFDLKSLIRHLKHKSTWKKELSDCEYKLEECVLLYKKLCQENEQFRKKFIATYDRLLKFFNDKELTEHYKNLILKKNDANNND